MRRYSASSTVNSYVHCRFKWTCVHADHIGDSGSAERLFRTRGGRIQFTVQWAEAFAVLRLVKRASRDSLNGIHRLYYVVDGDLVRGRGQPEPSTKSALGENNITPGKLLHYLGKVARRNPSGRRYLVDGARPVGILRKIDNGPQRIFRSL
jgi:hypothetical protein